MRAVHLNEIGSADNFKIVDVPVPDPAEGEVLIKVEDAGVIFADILVRRGEYVMSPPFPSSQGGRCPERLKKWGLRCQILSPVCGSLPQCLWAVTQSMPLPLRRA